MENAPAEHFEFTHENPSRNLLKKTLYLLYSASLWPDRTDLIEWFKGSFYRRKRDFFATAFGFNYK